MTGFIRCIALSPSNRQTIQDTLRLITLWFNYGYKKDIEKALKEGALHCLCLCCVHVEGFEMINIDTWLPVIPQIIARIHTSSFRSGIDQLLQAMGQKHPMALMFPITVAFKVLSIVSNLRVYSLLVRNSKSQASSSEPFEQHAATLAEACAGDAAGLVRADPRGHPVEGEVAQRPGRSVSPVLLREVRRLSIVHLLIARNVNTMMSVLLPLHELLNSGVKTPNEMAFQKAFGKDLEKAWNCCKVGLKCLSDYCAKSAGRSSRLLLGLCPHSQ